jgi:hypothetical protein
VTDHRVAISVIISLIGWASFFVHAAIKDRFIDELVQGETLSRVQAYGIFYSVSLSMLACGLVGLWLLLHSKTETSPVLRVLAWPLHTCHLLVLIMVCLVSFAEP